MLGALYGKAEGRQTHGNVPVTPQSNRIKLHTIKWDTTGKRACVDGSARDRELKRVGKSFVIAPVPQNYILYAD